MGHCRFVLLGLLFAFLLSGCTTTTYVPLPQTVEVPVTVVVTATPVAKATPTRAVAIPDNWLTYENVTGNFTFQYPPDWQVMDERQFSAFFEMPGRAQDMAIGLVKVSLDCAVGEKASVDSLVSSIVSEMSADTQIRVLSKGSWYHLFPVNYVEVDMTPKGSATIRMVDLQAPLGPGLAVEGYIRKSGECITLAELEQVQMAMASLKPKLE